MMNHDEWFLLILKFVSWWCSWNFKEIECDGTTPMRCCRVDDEFGGGDISTKSKYVVFRRCYDRGWKNEFSILGGKRFPPYPTSFKRKLVSFETNPKLCQTNFCSIWRSFHCDGTWKKTAANNDATRPPFRWETIALLPALFSWYRPLSWYRTLKKVGKDWWTFGAVFHLNREHAGERLIHWLIDSFIHSCLSCRPQIYICWRQLRSNN